ncbi:uncharacterized protein BJX67DRAFT_315421 [Aspergillus lucknowensis]|uniref:Uncharacterized protein n=1 Tax=Aspergillus lucknowensis TaxID=176173 RepID=A0ABR4L988_9EURO
MSGSLEMDGDNSVYNPKSPPLQNRLETHPNSYRCDNIVNEIARSPGTHAAKRKQHLTLDAALGPLGSQKGQRDSPGLPAEGNPSPEYNQQKGNGSDARQGKPDHVRRPSTNPPTVQPLLGLDEIRRRRSRSIGSGIRDPRIAAVGLSYPLIFLKLLIAI